MNQLHNSADGRIRGAKRLTILVVEDDLTTRKLIEMILRRENYEVLEAENGHSALQILETEEVNLIITDILMPELSGIELLRHLKNDPLTSQIPVILCTSVSEQQEVREAISLGIGGYILKPIHAKALVYKVEEVKNHIRPVLDDPVKVSRRLGMDMEEYKELLHYMIENADERLKEVGTQVEIGEVEAFENFSRDLSSSAENLGANSLQNTAHEAGTAISKSDKKTREKYLFSIRTEIERLRQATSQIRNSRFV